MAAQDTRRTIDPAALLRVTTRQSLTAEAPWLHREVARRMAERLPVVRLTPSVVVDWWSHAGGSRELLKAAYPCARRVLVEPEAAIDRPPERARRSIHGFVAEARQLAAHHAERYDDWARTGRARTNELEGQSRAWAQRNVAFE